jgi:molybdenum cofactor synthesis domain-containing protein
VIADAPAGEAITAWLAAWRAAGGRPAAASVVALADAAGAFTAEPLVARHPSPPWRCAAMDGIAVRVAETHAPIPISRYLTVDTGQPVAAAFDAVVPWERVSYAADGAATVSGATSTGANIREAGEDVAQGATLLARGCRVTPERVALAAACGHATVTVRRARVAVLPTGDEIREPGTTLAPGEVADSNSPMLALLAAEIGATAVRLPIVPDDGAALAGALTAACVAADLVLVIAGSARGGRDHTRSVIGSLGTVVVDGVALRPGHPVVLGVVADTLVVGVPGYPVSAALTFRVFGEAALAALTEADGPPRATIDGLAAVAIFGHPTADCLIPVTITDGRVTPRSRRGGALRSLADADGVLAVPAGKAFAAGDPVTVERLRP